MSLLKFIKAQLGISSTPTNNFTLDASAQDGTMKLSRGNAGATTQDVMTIASDGKVDFPAGIGDVGGLPSFQCRAWAVFSGTSTGTNVPISGGNVASITRNGVGNYTVNFTTSMPDADYSCNITATAGQNSMVAIVSKTASSFTFTTVGGAGTGSGISFNSADVAQASISVFK